MPSDRPQPDSPRAKRIGDPCEGKPRYGVGGVGTAIRIRLSDPFGGGDVPELHRGADGRPRSSWAGRRSCCFAATPDLVFDPPPDQVDSGPAESLRRSGHPGMGRTLTGKGQAEPPVRNPTYRSGSPGLQRSVPRSRCSRPGRKRRYRSVTQDAPLTARGCQIPATPPPSGRSGLSVPAGLVRWHQSWSAPAPPGWSHLRIGRVGDPDHDPGTRGRDDDLRTRPPSAGRTHHVSTRRGSRSPIVR